MTRMRQCLSALVLGGALMLAACQPGAPPQGNEGNAAAAADAKGALPVRPGIYGNVRPGPGGPDGVEMQVHALPRTLIEVTACHAGCRSIHRVPYQIDGDAMLLSYRETAGSTAPEDVLSFKISQQGDDLKVEGSGVGAGPVLLKRLPKRDALTLAEKTMQKGLAQ